MIFIIIALEIEAKPIINLFDLKRDNAFISHQVFINDNIKLIISGVGNYNSSIATTLLLSKYSQSKLIKKPIILNFGFAAAKNLAIGSICIGNKVSFNFKDFYPEMNLNFRISELNLLSVDSPIDDINLILDNSMIDMESFGIFVSATKFIASSNLYFVKIISDYGSDSFFSKDNAKKLIEMNEIKIKEIVSQLIEHSKTLIGLSYDNYRLYKDLLEKSALSKSQKDKLSEPLLSYIENSGSFESFMIDLLKFKDSGKSKRNADLESLIKSLYV